MYKRQTVTLVVPEVVPAADVTSGQNVKTWTAWDGTADITAATGKTITIVECGSDYKALKAGSATVTAKA